MYDREREREMEAEMTDEVLRRKFFLYFCIPDSSIENSTFLKTEKTSENKIQVRLSRPRTKMAASASKPWRRSYKKFTQTMSLCDE